MLGLAMALVLHQKFQGRGLLRAAVLLPWAMSPVSVGILWGWIFNGDYGSLNAILRGMELTHDPIFWLGSGTSAFACLVVVYIWNQAPQGRLLILAALQSMPDNLDRAAQIDGAGPLVRFRSIILPQLAPTLIMVAVLSTINALMAFDLLWVITKGGPVNATSLFAWLGYTYGFHFLRFGPAAAIMYILTAASLVLACGYFWLARARKPAVPEDDDVVAFGAARNFAPLPPRQTRRPLPVPKAVRRIAFRGVALLFGLWSILPIALLLLMSVTPTLELVRAPPAIIPTTIVLDNYKAVLFPELTDTASVQAHRIPISIWNSLVIAVMTSLISVVASACSAYGASRAKSSRSVASPPRNARC